MRRQLRFFGSAGQTLIEFAIVLPLLVLVVLGVVEVGYLLLDQHVVTKLTREGSNLISRNTSLQDAGNAMTSMATPPVNFASGSTLIFSVIRNVATTGATNYNQPVLYARYQVGNLARSSALSTRGSASFGLPPDYQASNSDNDSNLQVTNLPPNIVTLGQMLYVTEIYSSHTSITPLANFGVTVPQTLYSIAYF
jgi:Flp pilus assembly protein TadG